MRLFASLQISPRKSACRKRSGQTFSNWRHQADALIEPLNRLRDYFCDRRLSGLTHFHETRARLESVGMRGGSNNAISSLPGISEIEPHF